MMTETEPRVSVVGRYTEASAARALGIHRHTLERWRREGSARATLSANGRIHYKGIEIIRIWNTH